MGISLNSLNEGKISGFHGDEYEDGCLLGCCAVVGQKLTDVLEELTASVIIALMMEAASTSETSVNFYQTTQRNIPEDGRLYSPP
jgi:hypothetical protein